MMGKTNLSEWANFRSTRSCSGWSGIGGQVGNAYSRNRNPSGSSAGSGVAAAASFCAAAIGTETNGSILSPASMNGLVGFKPTVGLVSGSGVVPISPRQDTAGPMCRTVTDAAIMASIIGERALGYGNHGTLARGVPLERRADRRNAGAGRGASGHHSVVSPMRMRCWKRKAPR